MRSILLPALGALAAPALLTGQQPADGSRLAIQAARLVDPASRTARTGVVVLVRGSRIDDVQSAAEYRPRAGDRVIDLGDATLLPGLIELPPKAIVSAHIGVSVFLPLLLLIPVRYH